MTLEWTPEQHKILAWFETGRDNAIVIALAGASKTTMIVEGAMRAPERLKLVTSFNKAIVEELTQRGEGRFVARTLHAIGNGWWKKTRPNARLDAKLRSECARKGWAVAKKKGRVPPDRPDWDTIKMVMEVVSRIKAARPMSRNPSADVRAVIVDYGLAPTRLYSQRTGIGADEIAVAAVETLAISERAVLEGDRYDFDDMVWAPVRFGWATGVFDLICVDEAQDMSPAQIALARMSLKPTGRICVVGDPNQCIYRWRAADATVLARLYNEFHLDNRMALTTTFRCAKEIAKLAATFVPEFTAPKWAPEGRVVDCAWHTMVTDVQPDDFILSRTNAGTVAALIGCIGSNKGARIVGRGADDFANELREIFDSVWGRCTDETLPTFFDELERHLCEPAPEIVFNADGAVDAPDANADAGVDVADTTIAIADAAEAEQLIACFEAMADVLPDDACISDLRIRLEEVFRATVPIESGLGTAGYIEISTIHRIKGHESDRVWVLEDTFFGGDPDDRQLRYVAYTRARRELFLVQK